MEVSGESTSFMPLVDACSTSKNGRRESVAKSAKHNERRRRMRNIVDKNNNNEDDNNKSNNIKNAIENAAAGKNNARNPSANLLKHFALFGLLMCVFGQFPATLSQSIPSVSECEASSAPVFLFQHNSTNGQLLRALPTANFLDCSELCAKANDCVGVEYADGQCRIIGASASRYEASVAHDALKSAAEIPLITKSCVQSKGICASPFHFDVHEQKILVGFAREVVPADSIQVCLTACLDAFDKFGFECESMMYYPVDQECILNTEDRLDRPDLFVDEHEDTVIYLDNNCAGSQCYAPYVTQYVAVEGKQLSEELDHSFFNVDAVSCEELCTQRLTTTVNDFNCKSFMYNNETRTCILSDERSKPLGRANLTSAKNFNYYEKKCFASPRTCRNVPSFTRVPQMLLVGFAAFVMENVPSVTMCLDQCTNPPPETGEKFVCKSAMYYYNEQECILNAESRLTKPDLFIREEDDFLVDYFDINCHLEAEKCPEGKNLHTVKTLNAALPEGDGSLHVIETATDTVGECTAKCFNSAPEKCRSFNYDKSSGLCNLLYLDGKNSLRPQVKQGVDLYDLHCLQSPASSSSPCLNSNGTLYSRYLYTKLPGLPTKENDLVALSKCLDICSTSERCEGVNYNRRNGNCAVFARVEISKDGGPIGEKHDYIDFYTNLCVVKEKDTGFSSAVNVPKEQVVSSSSTSTSKAESRNALLNPNVKTKPLIREPDHRFKPTPDAGVNNAAKPHHEGGASASLSVGNIGNVEPVAIPAGSVHTICNYEGIKVQIKNDQKFTGVMFVKNKYESCRVEVENSDSATLVLGLPQNFGMKPILLDGAHSAPTPAAAPKGTEGGNTTAKPDTSAINGNDLRRHRRQAERDCGIIDMDNGSYRTTVVVQTNNLGIPGLVTSTDQIYEVSCNYSSMLGGKVIAAANMTVHGPQPSLIQPRGKIELGNPVLMQMTSADNANHPIIQAKLGDILELRWEIMAMDEELDFFVKDCHAEPGNSATTNSVTASSSSAGERLQLIEAGCPTMAVSQKLIRKPIQQQGSAVKTAHLQAFRFDSSSTVRITCQLEICKGNCSMASCNMASGAQQQSWGRKKRAVDNSRNSVLTEFETKRYKVPRFPQATTSLIIVDPLQQLSEPQTQAAVSLSRQSAQDFAAAPPKSTKYDSKFEKPQKFDKESLTAPGHQQQQQMVESIGASGEMCMNKWTLLGVLGTLFLLILIQALVVTKYIFKRIFLSAAAAKAADTSVDGKPYNY